MRGPVRVEPSLGKKEKLPRVFLGCVFIFASTSLLRRGQKNNNKCLIDELTA